jgi:hypothetical protein
VRTLQEVQNRDLATRAADKDLCSPASAQNASQYLRRAALGGARAPRVARRPPGRGRGAAGGDRGAAGGWPPTARLQREPATGPRRLVGQPRPGRPDSSTGPVGENGVGTRRGLPAPDTARAGLFDDHLGAGLLLELGRRLALRRHRPNHPGPHPRADRVTPRPVPPARLHRAPDRRHPRLGGGLSPLQEAVMSHPTPSPVVGATLVVALINGYRLKITRASRMSDLALLSPLLLDARAFYQPIEHCLAPPSSRTSILPPAGRMTGKERDPLSPSTARPSACYGLHAQKRQTPLRTQLPPL